MNVSGSYKKLLYNSKQAMFAAIEIYNKPKFDYREEVFIILLVNTWDLFLLAILSKNRKRIFQKKKKGEEYKTLDFNESYNESSQFFTSLTDANKNAVKNNLSLIRKYRNQTVHYYGDKGNQHAIYALSQSAIKNYVDLLKHIFDEDLTSEINIVLLPLSFNNQPNFIEFFKSSKQQNSDFVEELFNQLKDLEDQSTDTSLFITHCSVKIESTKNIKSADVISSYDKNSSSTAIKKVNPDDSYPFFQTDIIGSKSQEKHRNLEKILNQHSFQAIVWKNGLKRQEKYCWQSNKGGSPRYSHAIIPFLNNLKDEAIEQAKQDYQVFLRDKKRKK